MSPKVWESSTESTYESIIKQIATLPGPTTVILFGADGDFKSEIYAKLIQSLPRLASGHYEICTTDPTIHDTLISVKQVLDEDHCVLILVDGESSCNPHERHEAVTTLRELGAKSVVGVYARTRPKPVHPLTSPIDIVSHNKQTVSLLHNPPTAGGLDFLVTVDEAQTIIT